MKCLERKVLGPGRQQRCLRIVEAAEEEKSKEVAGWRVSIRLQACQESYQPPGAHAALIRPCICGSVPAVLATNTARNSGATVPSLLHASFCLSFFFHWLILLCCAYVTVTPEKKGDKEKKTSLEVWGAMSAFSSAFLFMCDTCAALISTAKI